MNRNHSKIFTRLTLWTAFAAVSFSMSVSGQSNATAETTSLEYTDAYWRALEVSPAIYETPYQISLFKPLNGEDGARVWSQTKSMFFYGVGVFGVLAIMPEELTGWESTDDIFKKWGDNITEGPVWDRDHWVYNYIGHTYVGGVYYQVARKSGYRQWDSFIYSVLMSTFYWEYGVEAFAEVPSIQDLTVTPILGWVYGEWAYQTELKIRHGDGTVAGSKFLGSTSLFFLDPIDSIGRGINRIVGRPLIKSGYGYFTYTAAPTDGPTDHTVYLNMVLPIGGTPEDERYEISEFAYNNDPVNTGIIGLTFGGGHTALDSDWNVDDGFYSKISLGLYLHPRISTRLGYAWGRLNESETGNVRLYENYSLDTQCYFNIERKLRPYVTAGLGEMLWEEERDMKTFQWNAGMGLQYRLHNKWIIETDWVHYYSPSDKTYDQQVNAGLIYRFGQGEHSNW